MSKVDSQALQRDRKSTDKPSSLTDKLAHLSLLLKEMKSVLVAYSGGVDSTLLLKAARDYLDDNVLAVTALSKTTPTEEGRSAVRIARNLGIEHLLIETDELQDPEFSANRSNRCYVCKKARFSQLIELAEQRGIRWVIDGENHDDDQDFRPGRVAARQLGVRSPLREAGLSKLEIRELSKQWGLPTWNKPAQACLASRIPYHSPITAEKLAQIDVGEAFLKELGFGPQLRMRHHGDLVRLELDPDDLSKAVAGPIRGKIISFMKKLGFCYVTVDLSGYEMGSLNRTLALSDEGVVDGAGTYQGSVG